MYCQYDCKYSSQRVIVDVMRFELLGSTARAVKVARAHSQVAEAEFRLELDRALSTARGACKYVADQCGVSEQHISDIRHGRRRASVSLIDKIKELK